MGSRDMNLMLLDTRNRTLLPRMSGLSMARLLDKYLRQINNQKGEHHGSIDALIIHNERTANRARSSQRCCDSPIEIAQAYNAVSEEVDFRAIVKPWRGPALLHTILVYKNGLTWKTLIPIQFLLKGWGDANRGYQCYIHSVSHNVSQIKSFADMKARHEADSDDYYAGITSRNWLLRLSEHTGEMRRRAKYKFHRAWRNSLGMTDVHFVSKLSQVNLTYEEAMSWEEFRVDRLGPNCLNMIPGGFKGQKLLHKLRIIDRVGISLEEREKAIAEYIRRNPRKGIPNPSIAELWKDDDYYLKVIEARPKTLSVDQVRKIRELASMGRSVAEIAEEVDALNEIQVKNVIKGKYYKRIQ